MNCIYQGLEVLIKSSNSGFVKIITTFVLTPQAKTEVHNHLLVAIRIT